ncbi:putative transcription factor WD40-like family [Helianthus annuus]|nr:putative transcription factor WD40-like family [Helianthus annuus]
MEKSVATLDKGTICSSWNYCGQRLATGLIDGTVTIFDTNDPASSFFTSTFKFKVNGGSVVKVVWVPPAYGDAIACICSNGSLSIWEEVAQDSEHVQWKQCTSFGGPLDQVLDSQFGDPLSSLKLTIAYSNGLVKVYEILDSMELDNWQLQAEFQNVTDSVTKFGKASCSSASISWNPQRSETRPASFVVGFNSDTPQLNSPKVWEFDQDHQRWLPVAELAEPGDNGDRVCALAWAPNIGRPYELIAVATSNGLSIWKMASNPDHNGRLSVEKVVTFPCHDNEVWQMEWDMSGMTLATSATDGRVRLWQSNLNGIWHEQAVIEPAT